MRLCSCTALVALAVAISVVLSCGGSSAGEASAGEAEGSTTPISQSESLRRAVQTLVAEKSNRAGKTRNEAKPLVGYYSVADGDLLWVDDKGLTPRANSVIEEIKKADDYGLRASDYDLPTANAVEVKDQGDLAWLADAEVKLSLAVIGYARDARGGRLNPQRLSQHLDPTLSLPDPLQVIKSIALSSDPAGYLRSFQPNHPQFEALRHALSAARGQSVNDTVINIPDGPVLRLGVEHEQVAMLRKRLNVAMTDLSGQQMLFDHALEEAVKRFQAEHGATPDGLVGPGTRRLLNGRDEARAGESRARLILLNMERWRWLPTELGGYYVTVNVPEFLLRVMADGKPLHTARVVVGKPSTPTPIFSDEVQEIVFNPYWSVPNTIKVEAIRPYITSEDGGFFGGGGGWNTAVLKRNNLRIKVGGREVDPAKLDWNRTDIKTLNIYQPPSPENVLGKVKFVFPNKHDVYMHDTPQKVLFPKRVRAASHGCMRVEHPDQLALVLLQRDQGWSAVKVAAAIENGYDQHVALQEKVRVYITYFTLWVSADGSIATFDDIYGHDPRMAVALFGTKAGFDSPAGKEPRETRYGPIGVIDN